ASVGAGQVAARNDVPCAALRRQYARELELRHAALGRPSGRLEREGSVPTERAVPLHLRRKQREAELHERRLGRAERTEREIRDGGRRVPLHERDGVGGRVPWVGEHLVREIGELL